MSWNNKIVWSEGMFLRPQHFQQEARYVEALVEGRCGGLRPYGWGYRDIKLDDGLLGLGKLGIAAARGVFPDGTPFNIPVDDLLPAPLDIPADVQGVEVFLALPVRRPGQVEIDGGAGSSAARAVLREEELRDTTPAPGTTAPVQVASLCTRLLLERERRDDYVCLGVARIVERRADKQVVLDEGYIPPVLDVQAATVLTGFIKELQGRLHHRADSLAGRVSATGKGGAAEIADFLLLQAINRYEPVVAHYASLGGVHPADFFGLAVAMAGELATFTSDSKRPIAFPPYDHEKLRASYEPVMAELRTALSKVLSQAAVPIVLQEHRYGIRVATVADRSLLAQAVFVLAVKADITTEELRSRFPAQVKIGPKERIHELVNLALPGIGMRPLAVAPRQLPFYAGYVYLELERPNDYWRQIEETGDIAFHVAGEFPGLKLELWAIRS